VLEGWTAKNGRLPVNPSGGLKAKGHPIGATGVSMHAITAMQLTGQAGAMQLPKADIAGVFNMGGAAVANYVSVLERITIWPHRRTWARPDHHGTPATHHQGARRCCATGGRSACRADAHGSRHDEEVSSTQAMYHRSPSPRNCSPAGAVHRDEPHGR
jgi:hypothetical protein